MKAIALIKTGNAATAFEVREIAKPQPQKGEVLIKVGRFRFELCRCDGPQRNV